MTYRAPLDEILFVMRQVADENAFEEKGLYADLAGGVVRATLEEAAKFAETRLEPLDRVGDREGAHFANGAVTTPSGWREAYRQWIEGGWNSLAAAKEHGGLGLPLLLNAACAEIWNAANMSFSLCPLLSYGAIEAMEAHANEELKQRYLPKMVTGEWAVSMNLTEPQAGSDLSDIHTRAEPAGDGSYRLFGQKIFITYGEHDMTANIVHFVLARLSGAPRGTRGISLFLVPKFLLRGDGVPAERNDVRCAGIEHKLGIHGAPTCTMIYGERDGAMGFLVGKENEGLASMFTMMNNARLAIGLQGVGMAERATQTAIRYARERRQGRSLKSAGEQSPIIEHPDIVRMLMTMKAYTNAARAICYLTAASLDRARRLVDPARAKEALQRASLLTPLAKAFSTDIGFEVAQLGIQAHGGMGYIEETGVAQLLRDVRIAEIYEGTNGIQAIDLVARKLKLSGGATIEREIADMLAVARLLESENVAEFGNMACCTRDAVASFERATNHMLARVDADSSDALAGASPYLRLFGLARGSTLLGAFALAARRADEADVGTRIRVVTARFFAEHLATAAAGLERAIVGGAGSVNAAAAALAN